MPVLVRALALLTSSVLFAAGGQLLLPTVAQAETVREPVVLPPWTCENTETQALAGVDRVTLTAQCDMQALPADDPAIHWVTQCRVDLSSLPAGAAHSVAQAQAMKPGTRGSFVLNLRSEAALPAGDVVINVSCAAQSEFEDSQESRSIPFTIHLVDRAPTCEDLEISTDHASEVTSALTCDEVFGTRGISTPPSRGSVTDFDGTRFTYVPDAGFSGVDTFQVESTNIFGSSTATVAVTVGGPVVLDTDGDGLTDAQESRLGTSPTKADTDGDRLSDGAEVRGSRIGSTVRLRGRGAVTIGLVRTNPLRVDTDGDGLSDGVEIRGYTLSTRVKARFRTYVIGLVQSDPRRVDTDRDGAADMVEFTGSRNRGHSSKASNPNDWDTDRGGVSDGRELRNRTDPATVGR